ncbi:hypothetical protein SHM_20560 [Spiroplasma ixodetis]|uniref:Uncharacterized protein n=1 Tax=Spiroplasma ixodetis TaxID=2141 RepID=A0ABM8BX08_9MOLU|nr:hypothetical protein SHM_20560 [Spiroplasma ixodetis]
MTLNEFNNAFQTEQQCLAYIANLKKTNVLGVLVLIWILLI